MNISIITDWIAIILLLLQEQYYLTLQYNFVLENTFPSCSKMVKKYNFYTFLFKTILAIIVIYTWS